ncbi:MAG: hypothetical protein HQL19_06060 [Candidatus Omnitrophica bacterium]|nr:hypothetical protein [Candidatus Omnitrophota bacterium]
MVVLATLCIFLVTSLLLPVRLLYAQALPLPEPGAMLAMTTGYVPPMLKGMKVRAGVPLAFDFILDSGNATLDRAALQQESSRLIKYFLAALTIPEKDLWVNLSPYEKDRIIPDELGFTGMGRDLLAEDYILKQVTASLVYPEGDTGRKFWAEVYKQAYAKYGTTDIPVDTFNKVWIVPQKAQVYERRGDPVGRPGSGG